MVGHGEKLCLVSDYILCCSYLIWILNFFLYPLQKCNGCPLLFYQTPPQLLHTHAVCCSTTCSYFSFPNRSTLSITNTEIYKSLFCTTICHLQSVNRWASQIPVLQRYMLPATGSLLVLKMEAACSFKIYVSNKTNIRYHNSKHYLCATLIPNFVYKHRLQKPHPLMMSYKS